MGRGFGLSSEHVNYVIPPGHPEINYSHVTNRKDCVTNVSLAAFRTVRLELGAADYIRVITISETAL